MMDQRVLDLLAKERVSLLAVCLPDGTCHSAAMPSSHISDPPTIYIQTENTSKKMQGLKNGQPIAASVVVGFNEQEMKTLQMDGQIQLVTDVSKLPAIHQIHYAKHHAAYAKNLNDALPDKTEVDLEQILRTTDNPKVRNNRGGHYNHSLFWQIMCPEPVEGQ